MRLSTGFGRQLNGAHSHSALLYWLFFPQLGTLMFFSFALSACVYIVSLSLFIIGALLDRIIRMMVGS